MVPWAGRSGTVVCRRDAAALLRGLGWAEGKILLKMEKERANGAWRVEPQVSKPFHSIEPIPNKGFKIH